MQNSANSKFVNQSGWGLVFATLLTLSGCGDGGGSPTTTTSAGVSATPTSSLWAGSSTGALGSADGLAASARFNQPVGITTDGTNLYVADTGNHTIRKIVIATGYTNTLAGVVAGAAFVDGAGNTAKFSTPRGVAYTGGYLYMPCNEKQNRPS